MSRLKIVPEHLIDVITFEIMKDPVIASDDKTYDKESITAWFRQCAARGIPVLSPWTHEEMSNTELRPNIDIKRGIEDFHRENKQVISAAKKESSAISTEFRQSSIYDLGKIFVKLDSLGDLLKEHQAFTDWSPPMIVVLGAESSGKSTILERLAMMSIFPRDANICTRLPIHVHMRRTATTSIPMLRVRNLVSNEIELEYAISAETGYLDVREEMNKIVQRYNKAVCGVVRDTIIEIFICNPNVPSLDLVDLPGLVVNRTTLEPENMRDLTKGLVEDHIRRYGDRSMYLGIFPANQPLRENIAYNLIQAQQIESVTVGVYTKCDDMSDKKIKQIRELTSQEDFTLKPHGFVFTMSDPLEEETFNNSYQKLLVQAINEQEFFQRHGMTDFLESNTAGLPGLVENLNILFLSYLSNHWVPNTTDTLAKEILRNEADSAALGLPAVAAIQDYDHVRGEMNERISVLLRGYSIQCKEWMFKNVVQSMVALGVEIEAYVESTKGQLGHADIPGAVCRLQQLLLDRCARKLEEISCLWGKDLSAFLHADNSPLKLGRFPNLISLLSNHLIKLFEPVRKNILASIDKCLELHFTIPSPSVTFHFDDSKDQVELCVDGARIGNDITYLLASVASKELSECLENLLATVCQDDRFVYADHAEVESCADRRRELQVERRKIDDAMHHIKSMMESLLPEYHLTYQELSKKREVWKYYVSIIIYYY